MPWYTLQVERKNLANCSQLFRHLCKLIMLRRSASYKAISVPHRVLHTTAKHSHLKHSYSNPSSNPNPSRSLRFRIRFPKVMLLIDVFAVFTFCCCPFRCCYCSCCCCSCCCCVFFSVFVFVVCLSNWEQLLHLAVKPKPNSNTVDLTTILRLQVDGARSKVYKPYTATRSPVDADSNGPCWLL